jgi:quinol monooxygenase YgiN
MHVIIVRLTIKPEFVEAFEAEMRSHVAATRKSEPGCLAFEVSVDKKNPRTYHLYEVYKDDQAMADHAKSPTLKKMAEKMPGWVEDRARYDAVPWTATGG